MRECLRCTVVQSLDAAVVDGHSEAVVIRRCRDDPPSALPMNLWKGLVRPDVYRNSLQVDVYRNSIVEVIIFTLTTELN